MNMCYTKIGYIWSKIYPQNSKLMQWFWISTKKFDNVNIPFLNCNLNILSQLAYTKNCVGYT